MTPMQGALKIMQVVKRSGAKVKGCEFPHWPGAFERMAVADEVLAILKNVERHGMERCRSLALRKRKQCEDKHFDDDHLMIQRRGVYQEIVHEIGVMILRKKGERA